MSARPAVLYVAYPLLTVSDESCGGAEQMLWTVETQMAARGYRTLVAASAGSRVAGKLISTGDPCETSDDYQRREAEHSQAILNFLQHEKVDLVHDHSGSFWRHAAAIPVPVLATLHLPRSFYPDGAFSALPGNAAFNCVSKSQRQDFAGIASAVVPNGIVLERFPLRERKDDYLLWMGRICEEKGTHLAIEIARQAGKPLVIAGDVYPFRYHQRYFDERVLPHLRDREASCCFVGPQTFAQKVRLLRHARAVLITSQCAETSSLVAIEAMACGTPVMGFRRGAIPEVVAHERTGFVVDTPAQMAAAVARAGEISPRACRRHAETNFAAGRMADDYERLYGRLLQKTMQPRSARAA